MADIPIDHVIELRNKGLSNDQVIQNLQRYGYTLDQINNAINQADLKEGIVTTPYQMDEGGMGGRGMAPGAGQYAQPSPVSLAPAHQLSGDEGPLEEDERIHEIAESIIDEKWSALVENVNKILDWKEASEARINKMEQEIEDMKHSFDKLHEGVLGRINEYDRSMIDLGTEIKALEKVFQKILPSFMENVGELSRITERMKRVEKPQIPPAKSGK